jgi:[ribosomal protein S18]-alanine N-acetyltransferase
MDVGLLEPRDTERVGAIARLGGQEVDVSAELSRGFARIWVARLEAGSEAIAFLLAWRVADELHVINVATHPDFRRRGAGRVLLDTALAHAVREKARLVLLEVRRSNRAAIGLYRARGFTVMGLRRAYYADNSEDAIEMMLAIDPVTGAFLPGNDELPILEA